MNSRGRFIGILCLTVALAGSLGCSQSLNTREQGGLIGGGLGAGTGMGQQSRQDVQQREIDRNQREVERLRRDNERLREQSLER